MHYTATLNLTNGEVLSWGHSGYETNNNRARIMDALEGIANAEARNHGGHHFRYRQSETHGWQRVIEYSDGFEIVGIARIVED